MSDLRSGVVGALRNLSGAASQYVITLGADAVEVDWNPAAHHHHTLRLPLILLTSAIDHDAAQARWRQCSFSAVIGAATDMDDIEKGILLAFADRAGARLNFASELADWIERFDLAGVAFAVNWPVLRLGEIHSIRGVRPIALMKNMPAVLKKLKPHRALAALAVLALYNESDTNAAFKGKSRAALNPPAVEGFATLRDAAGPDAYAHLVRLIAAYRGW